MGCSATKGHVHSWDEDLDQEGGKKITEPAKLSRTLRMKRYEWIARGKLAVADTVGGGLYDADNRSIGSLDSNSRRRVGGWVEDLPSKDDGLLCPTPLPGSTADAFRGAACEEENASDATPPSPMSSTNTLSLPTCEVSSLLSETMSSPVRLHSRCQLHMLERSMSSSAGTSKLSPATTNTTPKTTGSPQPREAAW